MDENIFVRKKAIIKNLLSYGFSEKDGEYKYNTNIMNGEFHLEVRIDKGGALVTKLIETETGEEYVLHKTNFSGAFVGEVRAAVERVLLEVLDKCYENNIFKFEQTLKIIEYVRENRGGTPEYLWDKSPNNAVFRRADNKKWYGALLTVSRRKLGIESDEVVEILNLKAAPKTLENLVDFKRYYPGWHMNKKHWYSVILDGSVPDEEIFKRIDESYFLTE